MKFYWVDGGNADREEYAAFRWEFALRETQKVKLRIFGASRFRAYLDGEYFTEGPYRFDAAHPQYEERELSLSAGVHVLSAEVHNENVHTRILQKMQPFFAAEMIGKDGEIDAKKKAFLLPGAESRRRINPELAWMENRDLSQIPNFHARGFDCADWRAPVEVFPEIGVPQRVNLAQVRRDRIDAEILAQGVLAENFGYIDDDVPARFFLRNLNDERNPADGVWLRYDLGKVRLFCFEAKIRAPKGTLVEVAYSETLEGGRVTPWITLSAGDSCNLDRYRLKEGENRFGNLTPRGGRYAEIHIVGDPARVSVEEVVFYDRTYFGAPVGSFSCGDEQLNRIWKIGVETFRSCAEDAVIDNPTRERGEWTGDVIGVGIDICSAAYSDVRLIRRGLEQSAWCASDEGIIAGLCPGGIGYLSTYALQWVNACVQYYRMTGERELLESLFPYAERNIGYFRNHWTKDGLDRNVHWTFVDWGYVTNSGASDMALNLHYHSALRAYLRWAELLGKAEKAKEISALLETVHGTIAGYLDSVRGDWERIGMHRAVLALGEGFFEGEEAKTCIEFVKRHYLNCFPNDLSAPRLGSPDKENPRLITPYFSHYAFGILWEHGEGDFVIGQYRACWGWLESKDNTWLEVFDDRWSHCHQWSGCPTWQLSQYVLGIRPRYDIEPGCFEYCRKDCSLPFAKGEFPIVGGGKISVHHEAGKTQIRSDREICILKEGEKSLLKPGETLVF